MTGVFATTTGSTDGCCGAHTAGSPTASTSDGYSPDLLPVRG